MLKMSHVHQDETCSSSWVVIIGPPATLSPSSGGGRPSDNSAGCDDHIWHLSECLEKTPRLPKKDGYTAVCFAKATRALVGDFNPSEKY